MDGTEEFVARPYQIDLYEQAVKQNTIIYLPTGTGKTCIAVMLIKKFSHAIMKPYSEGGKRSIFAVNTVPLVIQQSEYIARLTGLTCGGYSGDMQVDYWSEEQWLKELEGNQVLVMTSQICVDVLSHGFLKLNRVNLIIFDECHRAVNDHPMRQIMQRFESCPKLEQPRVLGLSATLLNSNVKLCKVASTLETLEVTLQSKIATISSALQVKKYCAAPKETIVRYKEYVLTDEGQRIVGILREISAMLKLVVLNSPSINYESSIEFKPKTKNVKLNSIVQDIEEQFQSTGVYGGSKAVLLHLIQVECIKKFTDDIQTTWVLEYLTTEFTKLRKECEDIMADSTEVERVYKYSSDHVRKLLLQLKIFYNDTSSERKFCCIIFVQKRFTAKVLYHILKNAHIHDEEYKFLLPDFVVGFSNDPYKTVKETMCMSKWNKEVLHRFRSGLSNCIVATDVIDEGIDIPICTLIIRYDLPMDIRAYVQSKGRCRDLNGQFTILLEEKNDNYVSRYINYKDIESHLKQILVGETEYRPAPKDEIIKTNLYSYKVEPYCVIDKNGTESIVTEHTAISLINRYCSNLLQSKFIHLSPTWILDKISQTENNELNILYKVTLKMPIVSPLKEVIVGDVMESINDAKRSAALKAIKKLHKVGELTDSLMPTTKNFIAENVEFLFPNWVNEENSNKAICGTYKKKRQYKLQFPKALCAAFPVANEVCYLHVLHSKPKYSVPHGNRHLVFYNLLNDDATFGILSKKEMPQIPSFPIFMNVGELNVDVKINHTAMELSQEQINIAKVFHTMIFNEIVPCIKKFMVFDNYNRDNCFLIVPVTKSWEINWDLLSKYQNIDRIPPSRFPGFKNSDYELGLVIPSYRASMNVYIVTQVCDDLTANSCFPTEEYFSYADYYSQRHGLDITDPKQPMLEVKPISTKINCIRHRVGNINKLSKRKRADLLEDFEEHLVPELCFKINFPALYWLKATMLPSVLHRVSQLLIAEDVRTSIVTEAGLGLLHLPSDKTWPPLAITGTEEELILDPAEVPVVEIPDSSLPEPTLSGPEIDVLNTEANQYPWSKDQEPPDLHRNIEQIQLIDIEYYCQFISAVHDPNINIEETGKQQNRVHFLNKPSIPVPPLKILSHYDPCGPDPVQIMYALTSTLGNDAFNLERLETLGDSYLKFIITLFLYDIFPQYNEGRLTAVKGKIIGNRNLYYCGTSKGIPGCMKVDEFVPKSNFVVPAYTTLRELQEWILQEKVSPNVLYELQIPPEEQFSGYINEAKKEGMKETVSHWVKAESQTGMEHYLGVQIVPDKVVADCVEALIGVYLSSMGMKGAATLLQWFKILPLNIRIDNLLYGIPDNPLISEGNPDSHMPCASNIEARIGYKFNTRGYLLQALTHPSYTANVLTECYQRLEFLGDAILDFLITCYIYETCGDLTPGGLTDLRSALVNNITFSCLAVRYGLHTALLSYAPTLNDMIDRFVKFQDERGHVVNDELLWILLEEEECSMAEYVDVPKVLGDLFESVVGAIYLDCGKDLSIVWKIVYALMQKEIDEFSKNVPKQPVRVLLETPGARPQFLKAILVEGTQTVMVPLKVIIAGKSKLYHGFGSNKKQAKCAAAKQALKSLLHKPCQSN